MLHRYQFDHKLFNLNNSALNLWMFDQYSTSNQFWPATDNMNINHLNRIDELLAISLYVCSLTS